MLRHVWVWLVVGTVVALVGGNVTAQNQPEGQLTIAFDTSIAPTYLDPAETTGIAAPFVFLYAVHDALLKPLTSDHRRAHEFHFTGGVTAMSHVQSPDAFIAEL